jgi:hypothetical protein
MTMLVPLEIGEVVQTRWDKRPFRVLAFDEVEVFYDCWWPEIEQWTFGAKRKKSIYYRMATDRFLESVIRLRIDIPSEEELLLHRPELPLRAYRDRSFSWTVGQAPNHEVFSSKLTLAGVNVEKLAQLPAAEIVLLPRTDGGAVKKGVLVKASDGHSISGLEVLWAANNAQAQYQKNPSNGVGIYRSGIAQRGLPSYYIGEYHDLSGASKRFEEKI